MDDAAPHSPSGHTSNPHAVLICGLGRLGQRCAVILKELGLTVHGIEDTRTAHWETSGFPDLLDSFTVGDCRRHKILEKGGVRSCRAILLTTGDERTNIGSALAARSLNPSIRLVIRSSQTNLNDLLGQTLGNLIAFNAMELPAPAFSLAALGKEIIGLFSLDDRLMRVVQTQVDGGHRWTDARRLYDLDNRHRRILSKSGQSLAVQAGTATSPFFNWDPYATAQVGDVITSIEFSETRRAGAKRRVSRRRYFRAFFRRRWRGLPKRLRVLLSEATPAQRVIALCGLLMLALAAATSLFYKLAYPDESIEEALNVGAVLLLAGYASLFAQRKLPFEISPFLLTFSLLVSIVGTVATGVLYAYLTGKVLAARLQFRRRQYPIHKADHIIVLGLGRLGRRVVALLHDMQQPVVGINETELESDALPGVPVVVGDLRRSLEPANCAQAAGVMALTDDDVVNLELALMAARSNPRAKLVIRADNPSFAGNISALVTRASALGVYTLSAEAFAAAALGEKVISLLRLGNHTVLITEYEISSDDTLTGLLISEVMYGYEVVVIEYQAAGPADHRRPPEFFPIEDTRLRPGDRMVVLATMDGLQNVERGGLGRRTHRVEILKAESSDSAFDGARTIARVTGCDLSDARSVFVHLPAVCPVDLYFHQAYRVVEELRHVGVQARVVEIRA
jgi:Trk K+ transport system NAD-binding subunit